MNSSSCAMLLYTFLFTARSMGVVSDHDVRGNATLVVGKKHGLVQSSVRADSVTAESYKWLLCDSPDANARSVTIGRDVPPGTHDADNQLCAATYIELYRLTGQSNQTMIAATMAEFDSEISDPKTTSYWSWVDALFMAMNPYARLGGVTGEQKYFDKMFANFNASCLEGPVPDKTYAFWSDEYHLFYRDDRFLKSTTFWGRGNGWAMGALVAALQNSPASDPHTDVYKSMFKAQAAELKSIQGDDGVWRSSLLNVSGYPTPETTGSSLFTFGLAYGINSGILSRDDYLPVVTKAWNFLSGTALQPSGLFGYCQPVGGSPEHNINASTTSDFCVGQFALAATQVAQLGL
eukprot:m.560978 g.560978  ORF g.560978 m.560978 type:complete len:349 (+) comp22212_c2_seq36:575-1621(+)